MPSAHAQSGLEQYLNQTTQLTAGSCDLTSDFTAKALKYMRVNPNDDPNITNWLNIWDHSPHKSWSIARMVGDGYFAWNIIDGGTQDVHYTVGWDSGANRFGVIYPNVVGGASVGFKFNINSCDIQATSGGYNGSYGYGNNQWRFFEAWYNQNFYPSYLSISAIFDEPDGWNGVHIPKGEQLSDNDGDGLNTLDESAQATSDNTKDTDQDGLNDYIESLAYPDRNTIFCGSECAYPNPVERDLYVEVDWMKNGNRTIKPSLSQISSVKTAFANNGILAHFDMGQYGGGNELPTYTQNLSFYKTSSAIDFYDYKYGSSTFTPNFNSNRYHIWHYLISGYQYTQVPGSSGASYVGDDDSFISLGLLEDTQTQNLDNAVSGTILHELGHSLCLNNLQAYPQQPATCVYNGIHSSNNPAYASYHSVMNYDYQFSELNLSHGLNTPEDHDDWTASKLGMADFTKSNAEGEDPNNRTSNRIGPNLLSQSIPRIVP